MRVMMERAGRFEGLHHPDDAAAQCPEEVKGEERRRKAAFARLASLVRGPQKAAG